MIEHWVTRRGIRRGEVPNPRKNLYAIYRKFIETLDLPDVKPATYKAFCSYFREWGVQEKKVRNRPCYLLSKQIVAKSVIDPAARRKKKVSSI